ncbi:MAG: cyclic nucleotide-binding domain-containing protein [Chloroflexi bacterium]|nr:cyclic nucleotide-binding domain-containing protein [Chloroflexota bacterium]OJV89532.1 MAG: hypothetical protein BGO39_36840 [Chloroflexi bacterium 54-19]
MENTTGNENSRNLAYLIKSLPMGGAVLHIGAHPDDEDVGLLAYLSLKYGVRTVYWSATRGEGGQNRISGYQNEALGILRTWESLAARSLDGGECLFGPFFDFGFCKTAEKAFSFWNETAVVMEIVRAIRQVQPQVVVARWRGGPEDGHGQHQAIGFASRRAFELVGDPEAFPQLNDQGLAPWQPAKYYCSTLGDAQPGEAFTTGKIIPEMERPGVLRINTGELDPIAGMSYQEKSWLAFNQHQSQGLGMAPTPGPYYSYFTLEKSLVKGPEKESSFFDGLDPALTGLTALPGASSPRLYRELEEIMGKARLAQSVYRVETPGEAAEPILAGLARLHNLLKSLPEIVVEPANFQAIGRYLQHKMSLFETAAARCLGLALDGITDRTYLTPGQSFKVTAKLWNQAEVPLKNISFRLVAPADWQISELAAEPGQADPGEISTRFEVTTTDTAELTSPYWLRQPKSGAVYHWPESDEAGQPLNLPTLVMECQLEVGQHPLTLREKVASREAIAGGYRRLPAMLIPPISLYPEIRREFSPVQAEAQKIRLQVAARNNSARPVEGELVLVGPPGWQIEPARISLQMSAAGEVQNFQFFATIPPGQTAGEYQLNYNITCEGRVYDVISNSVYLGGAAGRVDSGNCIKEEIILEPARVTLHLVNARFAQHLKYGYIRGLQEDLAATLKPFGVEFYYLTESDLVGRELGEFDAIVVGPNAYMVRDQLRQNNARLLEYVRQGGTLIVQYQGYGYENQNFTPYPFSFNHPHDRITYEDAPVTFLEPETAFFRLPNLISEADFEGWVRDRGLYFWGQWDKRYQTFLASADPGMSPQEGGLVGTYYGRGAFLYCGYSYFRQLPAGVTGAFRLFANILALPVARILERIDFLKRIYLFTSLTEEQLDPVARIIEERWFEAGSFISHRGAVENELFIIYRGEVEILRDDSPEAPTLALRRSGEWVGELAFLGDMPRTASMRAASDVELLVIKAADFQLLLYKFPDMAIRLSKMLVKSYFDLERKRQPAANPET